MEAEAATAAGSVAIPIGWFLASIGSLCGVIGALALTIFNIMNARLTDERERSREVTDALNRNTTAFDQLSNLITASVAANRGGGNVP